MLLIVDLLGAYVANLFSRGAGLKPPTFTHRLLLGSAGVSGDTH
jgi:hypothetical protein